MRRLGLIFVALAVVVQCLVVFQPPESANAANPGDFVPGGLGLGANKSLNNFLAPYDANARHLKDVFNYAGITREEIAAAKFGSWVDGNKLSWSFASRFSAAQGEQTVPIKDANGNVVTTTYARPLRLANGNARIYGWIGYSAKAGWFAIMQACGNLVTNNVPVPEQPKPANIVLSKTGTNVSQGNVAANTVKAVENDRISFTIKAENTGGTAKVVKLEDNLVDTLEYSTLVDNGGGTFNATTKVLSWPDVTLGPGEKQSRTFAVKMLSTLPTMPQGQSEAASYDCVMTNVFGNSVTIPVTCAPPKVVEEVTKQLPQTGPAENMLFAGVVLAVVTYFYLRSRQVGHEVRLIRRDLNAGTI